MSASHPDPNKGRKTMECPTCWHTAALWSTFVYGKFEGGVFIGNFRSSCWECSRCLKERRPTYYHTEEKVVINQQQGESE